MKFDTLVFGWVHDIIIWWVVRLSMMMLVSQWGKLGNKACEVESLLSIGPRMGQDRQHPLTTISLPIEKILTTHLKCAAVKKVSYYAWPSCVSLTNMLGPCDDVNWSQSEKDLLNIIESGLPWLAVWSLMCLFWNALKSNWTQHHYGPLHIFMLKKTWGSFRCGQEAKIYSLIFVKTLLQFSTSADGARTCSAIKTVVIGVKLSCFCIIWRWRGCSLIKISLLEVDTGYSRGRQRDISRYRAATGGHNDDDHDINPPTNLLTPLSILPLIFLIPQWPTN